MLELTPLVEPLSIDEAFLDLTGTERLHCEPGRDARPFRQAVEDEIGITVSIGLTHNKFLAKIASELDKPRGFSVIGRAEAEDFLPTNRWRSGASARCRRGGGAGVAIGATCAPPNAF